MSKTKKYSKRGGKKRRSSSRSKSRSMSRTRSRPRSRRGGSSLPASAWGYELNTVGDMNAQIKNSLETSPSQNLATSQSNAITPLNNINAQNAQPYLNPNLTTHKGGSRRSRSRKGGFWGQIIKQAAVPLALLGIQQKYKPRSHRK